MILKKKHNEHNHDKYITTPEFNSSALGVFTTKTDFDTKVIGLNIDINSNKTKLLLFENELKKLKTFDLEYFIGKNPFEEDGVQNYLVFQPMLRYFKRVTNSNDHITSWNSKGLTDESIKSSSAPNNFLNPSLDYPGNRIRVKFIGSCLKQGKATYNHRTIVNIYINYEISKNYNISSYPTL